MQKTNESTFYKSLFGDIFYKDSGPKDAPAVIFLHGVGMDHRTFDEQVNVLKDRYRVIVFDLPGHGRSTIKNYNFSFTPLATFCLVGLMNYLNVQKASFVGQSLGSHIAQRLQLNAPERVKSVIHLGGAEYKSYVGKWAKIFIPVIMIMVHLIPKNLFYKAFGRHKADAKKTQEYLIEATRISGKKLIAKITKDMLYDLADGIPEPEKRPMMICYGVNDLKFIRKNSIKWNNKYPDSICVEIPDANHIANQDNPEYINRVLIEFLDLHAKLNKNTIQKEANYAYYMN